MEWITTSTTGVGAYIGYWAFSNTGYLTAYGRKWPYIVGGYDTWRKGRHPMSNAYAFYDLCDETRLATMLEF